MLFLIEQLILIWHINYNLYNDNKNGQKVFSAIEDELLRCDRIAISVAFITRGGITPLLQTLKELEKREKNIFATQREYGEFKGGWEFPGIH